MNLNAHLFNDYPSQAMPDKYEWPGLMRLMWCVSSAKVVGSDVGLLKQNSAKKVPYTVDV